MTKPSQESMTKKKIAILGGGLSALTVAHELTSYPGWEQHYDVTVYQMGWRLGGKAASGRGAHGRIEELGIHIMQGWYENTFRMMNSVYEERTTRKLDPDSPFRTFFDALEPNNTTLMTEWDPRERCWKSRSLVFPENDMRPGEGPPVSLWSQIQLGLSLVFQDLVDGPNEGWSTKLMIRTLERSLAPFAGNASSGLEEVLTHPEQPLHRGQVVGGKRQAALRRALDGLPQTASDRALRSVLAALDAALGWAQKRAQRDPDAEGARALLAKVDLMAAAIRGLLVDVWDPASGRFVFRSIDDLDFRAWLRKHGAREATLWSPLVRFLYTGTFSNRVDGNDEGGLLSAATATLLFFHVASYKGSWVWQFRAGTGDCLAMPLYQVLAARGVRFEFFHEVRKVHHGEAGTIDRLSIDRQVRLRGGPNAHSAHYDPAIVVERVSAWPSEPKYDELDPDDAAALRAADVNLESPWRRWENVETMTLERGVDFDQVVLAIPAPALPPICAEILEQRPQWRAMIDNVKSTATQVAQLWIKPSLEELGFDKQAWGLPEAKSAPNSVIYANAQTTWIDQPQMIEFESWPGTERPSEVLYLAGPLPEPPRTENTDDPAYPGREDDRVEARTVQWMADHLGWYFPKATLPELPQGLDPRLLAHGDPDASGRERLAAQYYRARVNPSDRFVLAHPGTTRYRLRPDGSGYSNLFLAGDWTDFGLNVGHMEGAINSGLQCASAVRRSLGLDVAPSRTWERDDVEAA